MRKVTQIVLTIACIFQLGGTDANAQQIQAARRHFSTDDGLASNAIAHMVQDDYGAIKASSCVPVASKPYAWKGGIYFDGGLSDPIPFQKAFDAGCEKVIDEEDFLAMHDGAICCNAGHFDCEVDMAGLRSMAVESREMRANIMGYKLENGNWIYVLGEGRLVNLAAGDGHPAEIMDMSFAVQALSAEYLTKHRGELAPDVITFPHELDLAVARRKLRAMGIDVTAVDALTLAEQAGTSKASNVVLMGVVSKKMDFDRKVWENALEACVPAKFLELNKKAFELGEQAAV